MKHNDLNYPVKAEAWLFHTDENWWVWRRRFTPQLWEPGMLENAVIANLSVPISPFFHLLSLSLCWRAERFDVNIRVMHFDTEIVMQFSEIPPFVAFRIVLKHIMIIWHWQYWTSVGQIIFWLWEKINSSCNILRLTFVIKLNEVLNVK